MEDVAREANISKGCLYSYYKKTHEMLYDLIANYEYNIFEVINSLIKYKGKLSSSSIMDVLFEENEIKSIYRIFLNEIQNDKNLENLHQDILNKSLMEYEFVQLIESTVLIIEVLGIKRNSIVLRALNDKLEEF